MAGFHCVHLLSWKASVLTFRLTTCWLLTTPSQSCQVSIHVFSKLDAHQESHTFNAYFTLYGCFYLNKVHCENRMCHILEGQTGVLCLINNTIIYGCTQEEHSECLQATLQQIQIAGATLNNYHGKCEFNCTSIRFLVCVDKQQTSNLNFRH